MNILLLEDSVPAARSLGEYLEAHDCIVDYAYSARACLKLAEENRYDVLVLDIAMPGMDGLEACKELRSTLQIATPILFLTARDTLEDKLAGFSTGADDYQVKPYAPEELLCRLQALNARGPRRDAGNQVLGDLTINYGQRLVSRAGIAINLPDMQFRLLAVLAKNSPDFVDKETLEREVWKGHPPDSDAIRTHLYRLRNLVDKPFGEALIQTVHGKGYRIDVA